METRKLLPLDLQFFAEGDPEPTPAPAEPTPEPPAKTFTQDELDKIVADRVAREKKKLDQFADYDDLKSKISAYEQAEQERQQAEMTELEKLQAQLAEKETNEQTLAQQLADVQKAVEAEKVRNEFIKVATSQNIAYLDDALSLADLSAVKIEDGKVVGMDDAVKTLVDNKPFLLAKSAPKPIGEPANGGTGNDEVKTLEAQLEDAKKANNFSKVIALSNKIKSIVK